MIISPSVCTDIHVTPMNPIKSHGCCAYNMKTNTSGFEMLSTKHPQVRTNAAKQKEVF